MRHRHSRISERHAWAGVATAAVLALAAGCGSSTPLQVVVPATVHLSMTQAATRLCAVGLRVRLDETSSVPAPEYNASPAFRYPADRVGATGTIPAAGTSVAKGSVVTLRVEAPAGTFAVVRLPPGCQAATTSTAPGTTS